MMYNTTKKKYYNKNKWIDKIVGQAPPDVNKKVLCRAKPDYIEWILENETDVEFQREIM